MAHTSARNTKSKVQQGAVDRVMSELELANLGDGEVAYIKVLTSAQAHSLFPTITGLPKNINLFSLHGADGTPIALTDTIHAAVSHAMDDELAIASVH
jgi:hypothetical protein